jgi:hypothetical protein
MQRECGKDENYYIFEVHRWKYICMLFSYSVFRPDDCFFQYRIVLKPSTLNTKSDISDWLRCSVRVDVL